MKRQEAVRLDTDTTYTLAHDVTRAALDAAVDCAERGQVVSAEAINRWMLSWDGDEEQPPLVNRATLLLEQADGIDFTESAIADITSLPLFYSGNTMAGDAKPRDKVNAIQKVLSATVCFNPYIDLPADPRNGVRKFALDGTPFTVFYRATASRIDVLRICEARRSRAS